MASHPLTIQDIEEAKKAVDEHGSISAAARALGVPRTTLQSRIYATSTLIRGGDGDDFALQWIKEKVDDRSLDAIKDAIREALSEVSPLPPVEAPVLTLAQLWAFYVWGDPHFGQYSWGDETGEDYDLNIAQKLHFDAVDKLVGLTPPARTGVLVSVGDTTHGDDQSNQTPRSKHQLDVDTRWRKVLKTTVLTFERCIQRMLQKHEFARVIIVPGNHDPNACAALVTALACLYRDNPRVTIEESPSKFIYVRFGTCLVGVTHGDSIKIKDLGEIMASDRSRDWGETTYRHWFTGHIHQERRVEGRGWSAESLRTLAAKDAYAAGHGYRSARDMQVVMFDEADGEVGRHRVGIKKLVA